MLSPETVRRLLSYNPDTGELVWRERTDDLFADGVYSAERKCDAWNERMAGKPAFTALGHGYRKGSIFNRRYAAHRIAWVLYYGEWPTGEIDHINGDRADNRIKNLRDVPHRENLKNLKVPANNTSGVIGVSWMPRRRAWQAYITVNGKRKSLGQFKCIADAAAFRRQEELRLGFHQNHGRNL